MFADNTLTPREAVRLCALGIVAAAPLHYSALAGAVRHFCGRVLGPSVDLMAPSIELLRYEGLIEAKEGRGMEDDAVVAITPAGERALRELLTARLRPSSDLTKLVVALKFRFLHLLDEDARAAQLDMLREACETELARLEDLRESDGGGTALAAWLDHDMSLLRQRIAWLDEFTRQPPATR